MLRLYKYTSPYEFQEFETHLFTTLRPKFDHENDRLFISGQAYRISTINYIGLFNRLIDNLPIYTLTLTEKDETWAVFEHNSNFTLNINPKLQGCKIYCKITKTTPSDIAIQLPENSFGADIENNILTLSGLENEKFFLEAIYENGEFDFKSYSRSNGYSGGGTYEAKGFSVTLNKNVDVATTKDALDTLFNIQAQSPLVTLNTTPVASLREWGDNILSVQLTGVTQKRTNPITSVIFERNNVLIHSIIAPQANGGNEVYIDNVLVSFNTTFKVTVSDGVLSTNNSKTFSFVYPFYYGVGDKNLVEFQIKALTKSIVAKQNISFSSSPVNQVYYFAYPVSYGVLISILDKNGFETIGGYTVRQLNFTMLDGAIIPYYIYEFSNYTTQTNFLNTYKF